MRRRAVVARRYRKTGFPLLEKLISAPPSRAGNLLGVCHAPRVEHLRSLHVNKSRVIFRVSWSSGTSPLSCFTRFWKKKEKKEIRLFTLVSSKEEREETAWSLTPWSRYPRRYNYLSRAAAYKLSAPRITGTKEGPRPRYRNIVGKNSMHSDEFYFQPEFVRIRTSALLVRDCFDVLRKTAEFQKDLRRRIIWGPWGKSRETSELRVFLCTCTRSPGAIQRGQ